MYLSIEINTVAGVQIEPLYKHLLRAEYKREHRDNGEEVYLHSSKLCFHFKHKVSFQLDLFVE